MSRTISTNYLANGVTLTNTGDNPVYIAQGVTIAGGAGNGLQSNLALYWSITNGTSASVSGYAFGVSLGSAATVVNRGGITASATVGYGISYDPTTHSLGVVTAAVYVAGGGVSNAAGGIITSGVGGVGLGASGSVVNAGSIGSPVTSKGFGVALSAGGGVTNLTGGMITGGHYGVVSNSAASITNRANATIEGGRWGVFAINGAVSVTNSGTIAGESTTYSAIGLYDGGSVSNASGGLIDDSNFAIRLASTLASVTNQGSIVGTQVAGIYLQASDSVVNLPGGSIYGGRVGVVEKGAASTVTNQGTIRGQGDAGVYLGDSATGATVSNQTGGTISGAVYGLLVEAGGFYLANRGVIQGLAAFTSPSTQTTAWGGIVMIDGGTVANLTGGAIAGGRYGIWVTGAAGTVTNAGSISSTATGIAGGAGVVLLAGGSVNNSGLVISDGYTVLLADAAGTVVNTGTVESTSQGNSGGDAVGSGVALLVGGSVTNGIGGLIVGEYLGVQFGPFGSSAAAAAGTLVNLGTISASDTAGVGAAVWMHGPGVIINEAHATIAGGVNGTIVGGPLAGLGSGPFGIVAYYQTTVINYGSIGGATYSSSAYHFGTVGPKSFAFDASNRSATNTISNLIEMAPGASFGGVVKAASGQGSATLELLSGASIGTINSFGSVTVAGEYYQGYLGFGAVLIDNGARWKLGGTVAAGVSIALAGSNAVTLASPAKMQGTITGFAQGDTLELSGITVTGSSYTAGVLTLTENTGSIAINLQGSFAAAQLTVTNDPTGVEVAVQPPRTLSWSGKGGGLFGAATNWDDLTDNLNPAGAAPNSTDIAELLSGGGTISGVGTAAALDFGGSQWLLGASSTLTAAGIAGVTVGSGLLSLDNGARLISQGATDAATAGVMVDGASWTSQGELLLGGAGVGSLSIQSAGAVTAGALVIANTVSASGSSLDVSAADLTVTGSLVVGNAGFGSLSLAQGASVTAGSLDLAAASSGDGVVSVVGVGTSLSVTGSLVIGDQSSGEMSILGGAAVTIGGGLDNGNLDVEGSGSHLTINGGTLVVGQNAPAIYTLGQGTTQTGAERTAAFGIANLGGLQDPPYLTNDSPSTTLTSGYVGEADIAVRNSGTYTVQAANGTFAPPTIYAADVSFDPNSAQNNGNTNGAWVIQSLGTLVLNATTVDASQTVIFQSANAAKLVIGQVPQTNSTLDPDGAPTITGSIVPGSPNVLANFAAPIQNYQAGDVIALAGLTYGSATASGDVVTVWSGVGGQGTALGSLTFLDKHANSTGVTAAAEAAAAATQITALACFVAGTRIATPEGLVTVEKLQVGDQVRTADGRGEKVVWVGHRHVDCARHPDPETVWPVRIARGAFGRNVPVRDVYLSPDHAVFVNEVLVPVKLLVNGTSIRQVKVRQVTYHHVELEQHDVVLAEGLRCESYLDLGDRANFAGGDTIRLFPDFAAKLKPDTALTWETRGAAPLVMAGEKLHAARRAVARSPVVSEQAPVSMC